MCQKHPLLPELAARAGAGDDEAFEKLFATIAERALTFVRLRLGPGLRGEVESLDVLQDAYGAAFAALPGFEYRSDRAFVRWFYRLIENRIRSLAQHHGAAKRRAPGIPTPVSRILERSASITGPVAALERRQRREALVAAVGKLAPDEREVLLLRYFQEREIAEIVELSGHGTRTVHRLLARAITKLGDQLKEMAP